jgi:SNF2 family DNA or RNA helicase
MVKVFIDIRNGQVTKSKVLKTIRCVSRWKNLTDVYCTRDVAEKAADILLELERLLETVGVKMNEDEDKKPQRSRAKRGTIDPTPPILSSYTHQSLPPALFSAKALDVRALATKKDLEELGLIYREYFGGNEQDQDCPPEEVSLPLELTDATSDDVGMDMEMSMAPGLLAYRLSLRHETMLPYQFISTRCKKGYNPWDRPELFQPESLELNPDLSELRLHWHQLAGLHSLARTVFSEEPKSGQCAGILLGDEVGLGKTAQALASIGWINQVILMQERKMGLPPVIGEFVVLLSIHGLNKNYIKS